MVSFIVNILTFPKKYVPCEDIAYKETPNEETKESKSPDKINGGGVSLEIVGEVWLHGTCKKMT